MSEQNEIILGIDLGTTYSCVAYVDEHGKSVVLPNFEGARTTPSVVHYENTSTVIVGEEAKNLLKIEPDRTVEMVKRSMADPNYTFAIEEDGVQYSAEEVSASILKKLVKDASEKLDGSLTEVVITCPAYFGVNEREATRKAGEIAGLKVRSILNEPTAAAIAYGMTQTEEKVILVYDLGGGTFDVTLISVSEAEIKVIVTGGDHDLGGRNWDERVVTYMADRFKEENGSDEDILSDAETLNELFLEAEKAKKALTTRQKTQSSISYEGDKARVELTREKFEELTEDLLERTVQLTRDMLTEAEKKGVTQFDELILVGGSSKMPMVAKRLEAEFSKKSQLVDPDESVAKGAAIYGHKMMIKDKLIDRIAQSTNTEVEEVDLEEVNKEVLEQATESLAVEFGLHSATVEQALNRKIINVLSKSFGVVVTDRSTRKEFLMNILFKNEEVPTSNKVPLGTLDDNQISVDLKIMSNEANEKQLALELGVELGRSELSIPEGLPAGAPLEITYSIDEDGLLNMYAVELTEGREVAVSIETKSIISEEQLEEAKKRNEGVTIS